MSNFISNLFLRHLESGNKVLPRLPGRFEHGGPTLFPVNNIETIDQNNEIRESVPEENAGKNASALTIDKTGESGKISKVINTLSQKPEIEPLIVIDNYKKNIDKNITTENDDKSFNDDYPSKPSNRQIISPGKIEKRIIKSSNLSRASKSGGKEVFENKFSITSESSPSVTRSEKDKLKIFQNEQLVNLNSFSSGDHPELHDRIISPKQNKNNQIVRQVQNISHLHDMVYKFHNQLIIPIDENNRIFETKTKEISQPTVKVNIGRIEVRVVTDSKPPPPQRQITRKPNLTLEDYLKRRDESKS